MELYTNFIFFLFYFSWKCIFPLLLYLGTYFFIKVMIVHAFIIELISEKEKKGGGGTVVNGFWQLKYLHYSWPISNQRNHRT